MIILKFWKPTNVFFILQVKWTGKRNMQALRSWQWQALFWTQLFTHWLVYHSQTKLQKGNVFTPVCQSFFSWGVSAPVHAGIHNPLGRRRHLPPGQTVRILLECTLVLIHLSSPPGLRGGVGDSGRKWMYLKRHKSCSSFSFVSR